MIQQKLNKLKKDQNKNNIKKNRSVFSNNYTYS